jgi:serine/threonine protein kinase
MAVAPQSVSPAPTDSPVAHDNVCPHCGQAAPPGALAGLCPACLLRQGAAGDTGFSSVVSPPSIDELADLFPQLDILGLIGTGGMGAVYKARQRELDRMVALKILPPGIGDRPGFAGRFTREAKALAKLSHPGIVTIHDTGRVDGLYYLLMEFVDGLNLRQLIDRGRVSPREALAIVPMICDALQYAHDKGIVHRDIKPENILLDRQGRVKVADFGLAKLVGADELDLSPTSTTAPFVTQAGQLMGTLQYMAPEQIERPGEVDHRADIYSLGVVLYQMLTGELPDQNLAPPSSKVLLDIRLDEVVLRALKQNPDHRYQQVSQVKQSVETLIASSNSDPPEGDPAMEIKFTCPHCSQILAVDESLAGSQVSCPTCSQTMLVPPLHPAPNLRAPARQAPLKQRFSPGGQMAVTQQARGLAIWSLVLALIGLVPVLGLATGAIGLALGIIALAKGTSSKGMAIVGIELAEGARPLFDVDLAVAVCLVVGHEDRGLSAAALAACDTVGFVPQLGRVGSLNVAQAAGIAIYEARRQGWTSTP